MELVLAQPASGGIGVSLEGVSHVVHEVSRSSSDGTVAGGVHTTIAIPQGMVVITGVLVRVSHGVVLFPARVRLIADQIQTAGEGRGLRLEGFFDSVDDSQGDFRFGHACVRHNTPVFREGDR